MQVNSSDNHGYMVIKIGFPLMRVKHGNLPVHWPRFMRMLPITLIKQLAFLIPQFSMGVIMGRAQAFRSTGQVTLFALKKKARLEEKH